MASAMKRSSTHSPRSLKVLKTLHSSIGRSDEENRCFPGNPATKFRSAKFRSGKAMQRPVREAQTPTKKARPVGRASSTGIFTLYIQDSILGGAIWTFFRIFYLLRSEGVRGEQGRFTLLTRCFPKWE